LESLMGCLHDCCGNCRLLYRCEIVIGQRIRLTVSRMVMECFVKALYVVLWIFSAGREREMEENSKCFLLMCLLKYALHHRLINAAVKQWITLYECSGFTKNGRTLLHIVIVSGFSVWIFFVNYWSSTIRRHEQQLSMCGNSNT
ncbi:hypothetical protein T08_15594, partial [Trichinella sp. T8]